MNILQKIQHQFDTRILFGGALLNIGGETHEVDIVREEHDRYNKYRFYVAGKEVTEPYWCYQIEPWGHHEPAEAFRLPKASPSGGDATLFLPLLFARKKEEPDEDEWDVD